MYVSWAVLDTAPGFTIKVIFPIKEDERHLCLCSGIYAYFSLMQNISTLLCKKFEIFVRAFWKLFKLLIVNTCFYIGCSGPVMGHRLQQDPRLLG